MCLCLLSVKSFVKSLLFHFFKFIFVVLQPTLQNSILE
uniref:Uncharacterized protein n=1 Tax=Anguilla anguilla TaxID=7936 RepID=A0A0E9SHD1_ANGAN